MHTKEHKMIFLYIEKQIGYRKRYLPSMTQVWQTCTALHSREEIIIIINIAEADVKTSAF